MVYIGSLDEVETEKKLILETSSKKNIYRNKVALVSCLGKEDDVYEYGIVDINSIRYNKELLRGGTYKTRYNQDLYDAKLIDIGTKTEMDARLDNLTGYFEEDAPTKKRKKSAPCTSASHSRVEINNDKEYLERCLKERDSLILSLRNKNDDQSRKIKDVEANNSLRELNDSNDKNKLLDFAQSIFKSFGSSSDVETTYCKR